MSFEELELKVNEGKSIHELAKLFNIAPTTIRYWLNKYQLKTTKSLQIAQNDLINKYCPACNQIKNLSEFYVRKNRLTASGWCKNCCTQSALERQRENKRKAVDLKGGKCSICNYSKYIGALEFHHPDPSKKDPNYQNLKTSGWDKFWLEVESCILLCANCHREVHANLNLSNHEV